MEVVQTGPLVCASRPSSSHPPPHPRLSHRLDGDPTSALHVQTEEGGGGLDPSWWKISASGSWDGGERRMRYGKMIDDRPGGIPGAVQRRKLEMLETHAPGASMRVVHSQSTAAWVQDPSDISSAGLNSSMASSRRSVLASSSSSTRVTSFRQWSSNFAQNSTNSVGIKHETRPSITEFGNLELALNPLDVSFLRTRGNVGRSGSIGARRPPSRGRRFSTDAPLESPEGDDHSKTPSPILRGDASGVRVHDIAVEGRREKSFEGSEIEGPESRSEWPLIASTLDADVDDNSNFTRRLQTVLHRKRSVSSEDVRAAEETDEDDSTAEDPEGKWRRGAAVRRSLPSSEWRSAVGAAEGTRQRLRPRDPYKSSSVPALGGSSSPSRRGSFVTAESLREMKGRLKHRGGSSDAVARPKATEAPSNNGEISDDAGVEEVSPKPRSSPFLLRAAVREDPSGVRQQQEVQDDRRKSWSVGCRTFAKRGFEDDSDGVSSRRRSYAFEHSVEENGSSEDRENLSVARQFQERRGDAQRGKLWVDPQPYVHNRVNEVLKKWSALSQGDETEEEEDLTRALDVSPTVNRRGFEEERGDSPVKNSTTWLEPSEFQENSAGIEVSDFSPATMTSGGRTTLRVIPSVGPHYKDDVIADVCVQEKGTPESSFSVSGESMEDYMSSHGLSPIDWTEEESKTCKELVKNEATTTSAGISVTFSNADGDSNARHRFSLTHLDNRDGDATRTETQGFKIRSSKKVEFSKTEVHFAAESGRFHIVETAGKPPPSNNFRRRRRSPTGAMNVDSAGRLGSGVGSQSVVTNGMRFGDSPYEMRLLAGSEALEHSSRRNEEDYANEQGKADDLLMDGDGLPEYKALPSSKAKLFNELVIEEERDTKEMQKKILEVDAATSSSTFLHLDLDDLSPEKRRSIHRGVAAVNSPPWKPPLKDVEDVQNEDFKPKFGGVRLRPVVSPVLHTRVNVTSPELPEPLSINTKDKAYSGALSPGQMELQKLLRSLRHVSMTYNDNPSDLSTTGAQVANGGGMEVRISSGSQAAVSNTVIIASDSTDIHTPLSVAQRVREVEERRQKELLNKVSGNQRTTTRASGQFSTRVTLGSASSSVVSLESQVSRKTSVSQIESAKPASPKPAAKLSTHNNKIARIHNAQDKVGQLRVVRKGFREEIRRQERTQVRAASEERTSKPEPTAVTAISPFLGGGNSLSPTPIRVAQPFPPHGDSKKTTPAETEGLWRGNWPPTPSASWPSARGFGRVGDDRVMLKSPSLILQTMLTTAFSTTDKDEATSLVGEVQKETVATVEVDKIDGIVMEKQNDSLISGDKLQPKLSILRALYRDASEEEGSDAACSDDVGGKSLDGFGEGGAGGLRAGDGGSVVSGSWRRLRRSKQPPKRLAEEASAPSTSLPKPVPRRQAAQPMVRTKQRPEEPPPLPPPRTRNYAQRVKRSDGRGGGGRERVQEIRRGGGRGGECGGKGIASRLASDSLQHSQVATTSDIKISTHLTENHTKKESSKDVPMVTCIALGYQGKAKDGMKNVESKDEGKGRAGQSTVAGGRIDGSLGENPKRISSKSSEPKIEIREKSPEESIHSRSGKYNISSPSKDASSGWRGIDAKSKKDDDLTKPDPSVKGIRSQRRMKEISSNVVEKTLAKATFTSLSSPTAENKSFPSDETCLETFKDETRIDDVAGNFSIKMKVIKNQAEEEKSTAVQDPSFQGHTKTNSQCDYLHQRRTNTITTASKFSESECNAQKSRKENSTRTESRTMSMQASKSPMLDQRNKLQPVSSRCGNPETSSPSSGRAVRKRLRKRGSGGSSKALSSSDRRREGADDDSILEELTRAADEILHAVNGYSDEASSDEDIEVAKSETRIKRRPAARKESASRKLSSSSGRETKGGGSQRSTSQKVRARTTNGTTSPSKEGAQGTLSEVQISGTEESPRASRGTSAGLPAAAISSSHGRNAPVVSEKGPRSKQQPLIGASKKSMTRIEPTNRVAEVKLIEKRPPLPPTGQRRPSGLKERSEASGRVTHVKPKTTASLVYNKDGDAEVIKETKRPINIARALEAVMPDSRTKTRKIDQKVEASSIPKISETPKKDAPSTTPASSQSSPGASHSLERKKVASSRDGDKTTRRRVHQNITSPT